MYPTIPHGCTYFRMLDSNRTNDCLIHTLYHGLLDHQGSLVIIHNRLRHYLCLIGKFLAPKLEYLLILNNCISWQTLRGFPITEMSVWHMDFVKWRTYISIYFICASDAQTYWHCCLETYWHCSVSARLIDVAFTDLLALQPGTVTVTSERLWWVYCSFTCNPDTPLFPSLGYL